MDIETKADETCEDVGKFQNIAIQPEERELTDSFFNGFMNGVEMTTESVALVTSKENVSHDIEPDEGDKRNVIPALKTSTEASAPSSGPIDLVSTEQTSGLSLRESQENNIACPSQESLLSLAATYVTKFKFW